VIAQLVQADEDTVRDVIHRFNQIGLACLDSNPFSAAHTERLSLQRAVRVRAVTPPVNRAH
jgi:hypothetical protein